MSLEDYTKTNRSQHEITKREIHRILQSEARGRENAVSSKSLADRVPVSASTVRDLVPEIRREMGVPIGSSNGYFIIESESELRKQVERQRRQAENSLSSARDIAGAWYQSGGKA